MSGFGFGFGSVPFGGALFGDAIDLSTLRQLSASVITAARGDNVDAALKASNWTVVPLDPDAHERYVQAVQLVTAENAAGFQLPQLTLVTLPVMLLAMDGVLTYGKRYRVRFMGGDSYDFTALKAAASAAPADVRTDDGFIWDIANPYLSRDALVFPPQLGTYQVTDAGDVGVDKSGEASLRKRITRRVLAAANSYFHLQGYGSGVTQKLKRTISVDMLRRLSASIRAQVLREPEVQEVRCSLSQDPAAPSVIRCAIDAMTGAGSVQAVVPIQLP